jgi:hypothetical protein
LHCEAKSQNYRFRRSVSNEVKEAEPKESALALLELNIDLVFTDLSEE